MGVYIKGMDMPESCHQCVAGYGGFCFVCPAEEDGTCPDHGRPEWCPLIGLPAQHGRLIDAETLEKMCHEMQSIEWNNNAAPYSWAYAYESFENDIDEAPTIIEAEGVSE